LKNIVLIGFMGVGKGSIAREMVQLSDFISLDTDDMIESMQNRKIKDIFESEGEEYFRELEKKVACHLKKNIKNTIISTGGGFYKQKALKDIGVVVFLNAPFEKILDRIKSHPDAEKKLKKRPLLADLDRAKKLYDQRLSEYLKVADIVIEVADKSAKDSAKEILKKVKK